MLSISEKTILKAIFVFSGVVMLLVMGLGMVPRAETVPSWATVLPALNALINGTCFVLLLLSLYFIRRKNIAMHKRINLTAFFLSAVFMISYVTWHSFGIETRFPADNPFRPVYLIILLTHIVLAAIVLPLVLLSFYFGLTGKISSHRKITRWSFPVWLYVTFSGVVVYLMISPYYQFD